MSKNIIKYCLFILTTIATVIPLSATPYSVKDLLNEVSLRPVIHRQIEAKIQTIYFDENAKDGIHKIVIDAGHGGHDPGCQGAHSKEKDIALSIALLLGKAIGSKTPEIEVIYTRTTDIFIPLHKRIGLANKQKADVFISIHCNYVGNKSICGTETYVMGLHRAEENLNVAKRENSVVLMEDDFEAHYEGYDPNSPVGHILLSMFQNLHLDQSINLASAIESTLSKRTGHVSRGVKQAGFVVLRQATMPSILVETGFLSNAKEEAYLMSPTGQQEMADRLCKSILQYFGTSHAQSITQKQKTKQSAAEKDEASPPKGTYTIQIGVFADKDKKKLIQLADFAGTVTVEPVGKAYRYTVGSYRSKADAEGALAELKKAGLKDAFVRKREKRV